MKMGRPQTSLLISILFLSFLSALSYIPAVHALGPTLSVIQSSDTGSLSSTVTSGDWLVATVWAPAGGSFSDSLGNTGWTVVESEHATGPYLVEAYVPVVTGGASDTVSFSGGYYGITAYDIQCSETCTVTVTGAINSGSGTSISTGGSGIALDSGYFAASQVGGNGAAGTISGATTGFTIIGSSNNGEYSVDGDGASSPTQFAATINGGPSSWNYEGIVFNPVIPSSPTTTTNICTSPITLGSASVCVATVTGNGTAITGETITFDNLGGLGLFNSTTCNLWSTGACSISYAPAITGKQNMNASYAGDASNLASWGNDTIITNGSGGGGGAIYATGNTDMIPAAIAIGILVVVMISRRKDLDEK